MPTIPASVRHDLALRLLEVAAMNELSAHMTRVTLAGDDVEGLVTLGPTDHIKLLVPRPGEDRPELPTLEEGRIRFPSGTRPPLRDYTIRRHHHESNEIDIDIAVHGKGHVSSWVANAASVGAVVGTGGPRGSHPMPLAEDYALVGDLSSLPAIGRWLEELPATATAQVLLAAHGTDDEMELPSPARVEVHWVHSSEGVPSDRLADALGLLDLARDDLYLWAAGEVLAMRAVRDRLGESGVLEGHFGVDGYWRRGESDYDHHRLLDD